jgi:hypothetical protein
VRDISERFIDLGLEDHESDFAADQLHAKQERFERELNRIPFNFEATSLQLPHATLHDSSSNTEDHNMEK